jgi:hypothetical protein
MLPAIVKDPVTEPEIFWPFQVEDPVNFPMIFPDLSTLAIILNEIPGPPEISIDPVSFVGSAVVGNAISIRMVKPVDGVNPPVQPFPRNRTWCQEEKFRMFGTGLFTITPPKDAEIVIL